MRQVLRAIAAGVLALVPAASHAEQQQGSLQLSASVQTVTTDPSRLGGQHAFEPDVGVSWLQPGSRFGMFQIELRGARRGDLPHLGRAFAALRDVKYRGVSWTFEAGDAYITPIIGGYKFSNLSTPAVTFSGGIVTGRSLRTNVTLVGGRTTAVRNIFGSDPDTLGQSLALGRASHRVTERLEVLAHASSIRTSRLREFNFSIADSRQAGGGVRFTLTPAVQLIADAGLLQYRRVDQHQQQRDASFLVGTNLLLSRGWVQINAARFSPGDFPALHYPLQDRESAFAAAEYDVWRRVRFYGGWEAFRTNLDPEAAAASPSPNPRSFGSRGFGGVRVQIGPRSTVTLRVEDGDRVVRPVRGGFGSESDTGAWAAEWQAGLGRLTTFTRYSRRENLDRANLGSTFTQHDASGQFFFNVSRSAQAFAVATATRTALGTGGGTTYWQAGGGAQVQVPRHQLWLRGEATASRNVDIVTQSFVPRESLNFGINGQLSPQTTVAFTLYADRTPMLLAEGSPWTTRSTLRVTQTFATGAARVASATGAVARGRARGTGSVVGAVFADWNANGTQDPGEEPLEGIPLRIAAISTVTTRRDGQFAFLNVPVGLQRVGVDVASLPIDYESPTPADIELELTRGDTRRVAFGLIPLGSIAGRVIRDANANGQADPGEQPIDGAIVILDGGMRSEQARRGRFRFDAVRSGAHTIMLLVQSLPAGALIAGNAELPVALTREALAADVTYVVAVEKRPEVRKVFPPKGGGPPPSSSPRTAQPTRRDSRPDPAGKAAAPKPPASARPPAGRRAQAFAVQVIALNDSQRARETMQQLRAAGYPAYLVTPANPTELYRVRVGPYASRAAATRVAAKLEKLRGEKPWVVRER